MNSSGTGMDKDSASPVDLASDCRRAKDLPRPMAPKASNHSCLVVFRESDAPKFRRNRIVGLRRLRFTYGPRWELGKSVVSTFEFSPPEVEN